MRIAAFLCMIAAGARGAPKDGDFAAAPGRRERLHIVDPRRKEFRALFRWDQGPVRSLTLAKKGSWAQR
jgi:hypothetical protein